MTIRTKRRGWRSLAAILAAMLMASVLAVVAGAPAQAANTASEHLVDTNDDGKPDSRAFAGSDRYDTALRLAKHFANNDTAGAISTVIIASGETQIDAVAAAGVAGYEEAPVLLTRQNQLPKGVATFIEDQGVSRVYVAGGTAVISDDVVEQIEGLDSSPTVTRVAGDNRYGTAAALAAKILSTARWCGSDDSAVFLANGNQVPITSAILAGPMSYRMQMPLLLTADDALPSETSEYIDDNNIDRVVIIGNTDEVSDAVADEITALGATVDRVSGDDPAATSVAVAELMWGDCDGLPTDTTRVALVNSDATVDGVTGGPVAGRGLGNDDRPMAILLVGSSLPASVRDWLASTPDESDGSKTHLSLVAIGGTAVVSNSVMAAAVEAATTAPGLATTIKVDMASRSGEAPGDPTSFTITFSDLLTLGNAAGDGLSDAAKRQLSDALYVNGQLASISNEVGAISTSLTGGTNTGTATCTTAATVTVTLTHNLKAGDRIEVRPTAYKFGANDDQRLLQASSATVGLATSTTAAPTIEVIAIEGQTNLYLRSNGTAVNGKVQVRTASGAKVTVADIAGTTADADSGAYEPALTLTEAFDFNKDGDTDDTGEAAASAYNLRKGDSAFAERGAFVNGAVPSRYARDEVLSRVASFRANSVQVGARDTGVDDDPSNDAGKVPAHLVVPPSIEDVSERATAQIGTTVTENAMTITGLWAGDAAGAAGNDWQIAIDSNANYNPNAATAEIDVSVSNRTGVAGGGLIRVQFLAGAPTLGDLAAALMGNDEFADNFALTYDCSRSRIAITRANFETTATPLTGGVSSVGIQVSWNDWVSGLMNADSTTSGTGGEALRDDLFNALVAGYDSTAGTFTAPTADTATADEVTATVDVYSTTFTAPAMSAHIRFSTSDATKLPGVRTGSGRGVIVLGGDYYTASAGASTDTHVAVNYLLDANSDDTPVETDNDKDGDATTGARATSEPVESSNIGQTVRAGSGSVKSGSEVTS